MENMGIALQLYTLRREMASNVGETLRKVAEMGYEGVEFAGYFGMTSTDLKFLLDELGLKAVGSHVSLQNLRQNLAEELEYLKTLGSRYLVCPYIAQEERKDAEAWKQLFSLFEKVGTEARKQGLQFAYHNHEFEFEQQIGSLTVFDAMYEHMSPEILQVEMDVCWVQYAGYDPLDYIAKYAGRLPLLHLKDFNRDEANKMVTLELGQGVVNLEKVIAASSAAKVEWLIVEQDHCQNPPLVSVANSLNWLKERMQR